MSILTESMLGTAFAAIGHAAILGVALTSTILLVGLVRGRSAWGGDTCPSCEHPLDDHRDGRCTHDCGCQLNPWRGLSFSQSEEGW